MKHQPVPAASTPTILSKEIELFIQNISFNLTPNSLSAYRVGLKSFADWAGNRTVSTIRTAEMNDYTKWMLTDRKMRPSNARYNRSLVMRFFQWCYDQGNVSQEHLDCFITRKLIKLSIARERKIPIKAIEHAAILRYLTERNKKEWVCAATVGWNTGLRLVDVCKLTWEQVDLNSRIIDMTPKKTIRFGKRVTIPMDDEFYQFMLEQRAIGFDSPYVNPYMAGRYDANMTSRDFCAYSKRVGVNKGFHCYRHAFVSRLLNAGVHPLVIQSMTGQSLKQIAEYATISVTAQREALAKAKDQKE